MTDAWSEVQGVRAMESIQLLAQNRVTRRDYIAAQVFNAYMTEAKPDFWENCDKEGVAEKCYEWADAFEKARNKR